MNTININSTDLSLIFWRKILDNSFLKQRTMQKDFFKKIDSLDELRLQSSYNTGSISSTTSWLLFSITLFFKPKIICEVGSFIGKSTFSMAFAARFIRCITERMILRCKNSTLRNGMTKQKF